MLIRVPRAEVVPNSPKTKKETLGLTNKPRQAGFQVQTR